MKFFEYRQDAKRLSNVALRYLEYYAERWVCVKDKPNILMFHDSAVTIRLVPRRLRIFDGIHVQYKNTDVWIPLRHRLKLRRKVRSVLAIKAHVALSG